MSLTTSRDFGTFVTFAGSGVACNIASFAAGTLVLLWIDPAHLGIWQSLLLAQSYFGFLRMGVLNGLNRELPYFMGRGETAGALALTATAQLHTVGCAALVFSIFGGALVAFWGRGYDWRVGIAATAVTAGAGFYLNYLQATFRSNRDFRKLAGVQYFQALTTLALPLFVLRWGFYGLCGHAVAQGLATLSVAHYVRPIRVRPRLDLVSARLLLRTGLPLFVTSYISTLAIGFDRLVLLHVGGVTDLGYYAPATAVLAAMSSLPNIVGLYLYPRLSFKLGAGAPPKELWRLSLRAMMATVAFMVPVAAIGWFIVPWAFEAWFPRYLRSVPAVQIALLTGLALAPGAGTAVLGTLRAWKPLFAYVTVFAGLKWVLPLWWATHGDPITAVAYGGMWASLIATGLGVFCVYRVTHRATDATGATDTPDTPAMPTHSQERSLNPGGLRGGSPS